MKKLRVLVVALLATLSLMAVSAPSAQAHKAPSPAKGTFTLNAEVLDGGQQVVSVTIDAGRLGIKASSLDTDTFTVTATGTNPYTSLDPATVFGTYTDVTRTVTGVHLDGRGRIVIELAHGFTTAGAFTFAWANSVGRNIMLDLTYTITQNKPITGRNGAEITLPALTQGAVVDPEVDAYGYGRAAGLNYRLYSPRGWGKRPLVVWLHGGGEGGWAEAQNNDLPLIANRGALGFSTARAQAIFGGAYVLAPQATDFWLNDPAKGYSAKLKALIDSVVARNHIDRSRIYVVGASNGGYMTPRLVADNPGYFAAEVPTCPVLVYNGTTMITDDELAGITTPTWVVQATNDPVVPFTPNGKHLAATVPNALLTAYDGVVRDGVTYNGHWSWIYVARNDPRNDNGQHLWQWMAKQRLGTQHHHR
ncbi:MAG: prolyl oligopeptidase family serine peptidase [Actinobacteria bacterium]|nr:prolyl oligopeptidase family serine peptidase [Actinomycetota bacterium]